MQKNNEITKKLFDFDVALKSNYICGVDEAGRGPLAGPVVCAAVIMPYEVMIEGINDSKKISEPKRETLYNQIIRTALAYKIVAVSAELIDKINILEATKRGMEEAILGLKTVPDTILVDAVKGLNIGREYIAIIKGDATSYSIACASILAKYWRDSMMKQAALNYPLYGFEKNKGYGTLSHIEAFKLYGKTPLHRETFLKNFQKDKDIAEVAARGKV